MARDDDEALAQEREWQAIVENYGERAVLEPENEVPEEVAAAPPTAPHDDDDGPREQDPVPPEDEFVPPTPPPLPRPPLDRLLAWIGVFGIPAFVLVCVVLGIGLPSWAGLLLAAGFIGGFVYLVIRLPGTPRDPWDDGAVL